MRRSAGPRPRRHYAGHELKDRVPEATLGIAARGEARLFSRSAEGPDYASGVSGSCPKGGERQGPRVGLDLIKGRRPKPTPLLIANTELDTQGLTGMFVPSRRSTGHSPEEPGTSPT